MAIIPISSLPAASAAQLTDELPENQGGTTKKVTLQQISDLISGPFTDGIGTGSVKTNSNTASGDYSFSFGNGSIASGISSFSFSQGSGLPATASGDNSFAFGNFGPLALGAFSFSFGNNVNSNLTTPNDYSFAFGQSINAGQTSSGLYTFSFGNQCVTSANFSWSAGFTAISSGTAAWSFGFNVTSSGTNSFAFGNGCTATTDNCVAWGNSAISTNVGSWVINDGTLTATDTAVGQFVAAFTNGYRLFGGNLNVNTLGKGLAIAEGSNAKQGIVTLIAGVGVVSNTSVTANSRIFYCGQDTNVTGFLTITARTASSGFTITSSVNTDTGVVAYEIFEPAA